MTFYVFLSCLTRFLEHWLYRQLYALIGAYAQRTAPGPTAH